MIGHALPLYPLQIEDDFVAQRPVSAWKKYLALTFVAFWNMGLAFYVCLFG